LKTELSISGSGKQAPAQRRRDALSREIILALLVKILLITALWYAFFSEPVDDNLTGSQVGNVLFDAPLEEQTSQDMSDSSFPETQYKGEFK
jgi:hypothetical protein